MLTAADNEVDAAVRVSVTELAVLKGVSKQAISKRLKRLSDEGLIATARRGTELTVSLAEWDSVTGEVTDPSKLAGAATTKAYRDDEAEPPRHNATYTREKARQAGYEADLKEIELRRRRGELVEAAAVTEAVNEAGEAIIRDLERLPAMAEDLADVVARGGAPGLREQLKKIVRDIRGTLTRSMSALAARDDDPEAESA